MYSPRLAQAAGLLFVVFGLADCHSDHPTSPDLAVVRLQLSGVTSMRVGATQSIDVIALAAKNEGVAPPPVTWTSSDVRVATVDANGVVRAITPGIVTIAARAQSVTGTLSITVTTVPASLKILAPTSMVTGSSTAISLAATDLSGGSTPPPDAVWRSSNPEIASVSVTGESVLLAAVSPGSSTITATAAASMLAASIVVTVSALKTDVRMTITPLGEFGDTLQIAPGQTIRLASNTYTSDGTTVGAGAVAWSSATSDVATVSADGVVIGVAPGVASIIASSMQTHSQADRPVKVAATPGIVSLRLVHAADDFGPLTFDVNTGKPVVLAFGEKSEQQVPAGTLQVSAPSVSQALAMFFADFQPTQQFIGFVPAQTHLTVLATSNADEAKIFGPISFAPIWDYPNDVSSDSVEVQVVLATRSGFNVYFTPVGAQVSVPLLIGCYLDWPYGLTAYVSRPKGSFDIALQPGKAFTGPIYQRFTVTPQPGHATTYVITGTDASPSSLSIMSILTR